MSAQRITQTLSGATLGRLSLGGHWSAEVRSYGEDLLLLREQRGASESKFELNLKRICSHLAVEVCIEEPRGVRSVCRQSGHPPDTSHL